MLFFNPIFAVFLFLINMNKTVNDIFKKTYEFAEINDI